MNARICCFCFGNVSQSHHLAARARTKRLVVACVCHQGSIQYLDKPLHSRAAMATCCYPRCIAVYDVVRFCPKCEASFAVCASHRHAHLQCPWPTLSGIQCLAHVPMDRHMRAPLTHGPMYVCLPAHAGEPPGLHRLAETEHASKARRSGESPNTEVRDGKGASYCQPCTKKLTAAV